MECLEYQPIGKILVRDGVISPVQVQCVVNLQQREANPPRFGDLTRRLFHVPDTDVESAGARQNLHHRINIQTAAADGLAEPAALATVSRRRAWQFQVVPIAKRRDRVVLVTSEPWLPRAARFVNRCLSSPTQLAVIEDEMFRELLRKSYPWPGMDDMRVWGRTPGQGRHRDPGC